jgi:hypothetical protein
MPGTVSVANDISAKPEKAGLGREFARHFVSADILRALIVLDKGLVDQEELLLGKFCSMFNANPERH